MYLLLVSLWLAAASAAERFAFAPPISQFPGIDPALVAAASFSPPAPIALSSPSSSSTNSFSSSEAFAPPPSESYPSVENPPLSYHVSFSPPAPSFSSPGTESFALPLGAFAPPPSFSNSVFSSTPYAPPASPANAPSAPYAPPAASEPYVPPPPSGSYAPPSPSSLSFAPPSPIKHTPHVPAFSIPHAPPTLTNAPPASPAISYGPPGYAPSAPFSAPPPPPPHPPPPPPPKTPASVYGIPTRRQGFGQQDDSNQQLLRFNRPYIMDDYLDNGASQSFNEDLGSRYTDEEDYY